MIRVCPICGLNPGGDALMCSHHSAPYGDDWSARNRAMCDFIHRGIAGPSVPMTDAEREAFFNESYL